MMTKPSVSVIVPCYNEQSTIGKLLEAIYAQTFPRANLEVVIADGMSGDGTREAIRAFADSHPDLQLVVVDNPKQHIPAGLNAAIKNARGEIILRLDGHSMPYPDYIARCVACLEAGLGENVGGVWEVKPGGNTWMAQAIAAAGIHPLGVGDALYRHAKRAASVDTVPFGAFKRELLALTGYFDETLLTNEDYEFNTRIRKAGGTVWLDPSIRSIYFARTSLPGLGRQYFRYGYWKWRMLRRYPETVLWRQGLPPLFVLSLLGMGLLGFFQPLFWVLLATVIIIYSIILIAAGFMTASKLKKFSLVLGFPLAISCMHICWGAGFLWSMIVGVFTAQGREKE